MPNEGKLKKRLRAGEVVVGPFCTIPSMAMVEALGRGGMDFLIISQLPPPQAGWAQQYNMEMKSVQATFLRTRICYARSDCPVHT